MKSLQLTGKEIREIAKESGVKGYNTMNTEELTIALEKAGISLEEKGVEKMSRLRTLTVKELKEMAKEAGVKGFSKMRKTELVEALAQVGVEFSFETIEEVVVEETATEIIEEATTTVDYNTAASEVMAAINNNNNKGEKTMIKDNKKTMEQFIKDKDAFGILAIMNARHNNTKVTKMIKQESKNLEVIATRQITAFAEEVGKDDNGHPVYDLGLLPEVAVGLESNLLRAANTKEMKFADDNMMLQMKGSNEIISISLDKNLFKNDERFKPLQDKLFNILTGKGDNTLALRISESGIATVFTSKIAVQEAQLKETQSLITYKFLGLTPSGLRSFSFMGASVQIKTKDTTVGCDRRTYLLDKSTNGCLTANFLEEDKKTFVKLKSELQQFKDSTRLTLGAPGSKELRAIDTYVVFNNIAEGALFTNAEGVVESAADTCDGHIIMDTSIPAMSSILPLKQHDYSGVTDQIRGAGLKVAATYMDNKDIRTLFNRLNGGAGAQVAYIVVNGVRYEDDVVTDEEGNKTITKTAWSKVVDAGLAKEFLANIEMIADLNGMKMRNHDNIFNPVRLKMAYQSQMGLSMVTAMACLLADPDNAPEMLARKGLNGIAKKFEQLNVKFDVENGDIVKFYTDFTTNNGLNNEAQTMSYLDKLDPIKTLQAFPNVKRHDMENAVKGIMKELSETKFELEDSQYTVIQADKSVLYGFQLLAEDEMFIFNALADRVAASRHPISSLYAVTTFRTVSPIEMIERILALPTTTEIKRFLLNYTVGTKGVCIIPASHFLMEKHDGADFDIDTFQLIYDQDVVECLSKLPNRGSKISQTPQAKADRLKPTKEEIAIMKFKANPEEGLVRPVDLKSNAVSKDKSKELSAKSSRIKCSFKDAVEVIETKKVYTLEYDSVLGMSRKYFNNELASVGEIANSFYNNALTLIALKSKTVDEKTKEAIVMAFRKYYRCSGKKPYVSKIDRTLKSFEVAKSDCTDIVFRFAESNGDIHSLIAYLEDCCDYNRYLAETSIDAAKNNYFVANLYNHNSVMVTLGAKADCKFDFASLEASDKSFAKICEANEIETVNNYFRMKLVAPKQKDKKQPSLKTAKFLECGGKVELTTKFGTKILDAALAIEDPLFAVKFDLAKTTNNLIVIASKLLQAVVNTDEAQELRNQILDAAKEARVAGGIAMNKDGKIQALEAIPQAYRNTTESLREVHTNDDSKEIEGVSKVEYVKNVVTAALRNNVLHAFDNISSSQLGAIICGSLVQGVSSSSCGAVNAAFYKVCEKEIVDFLAEIGFNKAGLVGEELSYGQLNNRIVKLSNYVGTNIAIVDGIAELEDGTRFTAKNRRANLTGTIVEIDNKFYVQSIRQFKETDADAGLIINTNLGDDKLCDDIDNVDVVSYEFRGSMNHKGHKVTAAIVAKDAQDKEYLVATLITRKGLTDVLKKIDLTNMEVRSNVVTNKSTGKKYTTRVVYIPGADYKAALNNTVEESTMFDFLPVAPESEGLVPTTTVEEEISMNTDDINGFDFDAYDFDAPVFA